MTQSETINDLVKALVAFHTEIGTIKKDSTNPFFNSKYASLSQVLSQVLPVLSKNGLTIIQAPSEDGLTTTLAHSSGQYISSQMRLMPVKADPQAQGSAITYARRYAVASILSLNIDEDDDANAATQSAQQVQKVQQSVAPKAPAPSAPVSDEDRPWLNAIDKNGVTTQLGHQVAQQIAGGATSWEAVYGSYKVSKKDRAELQRLVAEYQQSSAHPTRAEQEDDEPLPF